MSKIWGYARVSTTDQNLERQIQAIRAYCPEIADEDIFKDMKSGKDFDRQEYQILKRVMRTGDTLIIKDTERLGRNKALVKSELAWLKEHGIRVKILSLPTTLVDLDEKNSWVMDMVSAILLEVYTSLDENDYNARRSKQREGIELAKARGVYKGRKPMNLDQGRLTEIYRRWRIEKQITAVEAQKILGLTNSTFYRKMKVFEAAVEVDKHADKITEVI
jgi:DNA invertase Pin-like site-specific DNA recombinase